MQSNLSREYANLIEYLKKQKSITSSRVKKKTPTKNNDISESTKQLLEECSEKIHSDIPLTKNIRTSKGFDVSKFESLMRSKLIDDYKRQQSYERPYISVTELISCIRKAYYSRLKYAINLEKQYRFSYLYLINRVGNVVHDLVQDLYDFIENEKPVLSEKFGVKGRIDGIRDNFVFECKTIDKDKFQNKYLESHFHQGNIYAYILNVEYNYNIDTITIVYFTRDFKRIFPFDVPVDLNKAEDYLRRAPRLRNCIDRKIVPDPLGADKEQCKWCSYKKYCEEDRTEIMQPFKIKSKVKKKSVFLL